MAIFGCEFGECIVTTKGGEIECTVTQCGPGCMHYQQNGKCKYKLEKYLGKYKYCKLYLPISDHIWWNHQWWN